MSWAYSVAPGRVDSWDDGLTVNGAPLMWLICPVNWKPPKIAPATPWVSERLAAAEGQMVDSPELEVVGAVVAGLGPVQVEVARIRIGRAGGTRTGTIICIVKCMRPGVVQAVLISATCIARQLRLQGVVLCAEDWLVHGDAAGVVADIAGEWPCNAAG